MQNQNKQYNKSLSITHVVRQFHPMIGGLENYVLYLAMAQVGKGHNVKVVTLDTNYVTGEKLPEKESVNGVSVVRIPFWGSKKYPIATSVLKHIKEADVVNVHAIDFFADFLAFTKLIHKKRIVLTTHGGFFHTSWGGSLKKLFFNVVTRLSVKPYASVIACSNNDALIFKKIRPDIITIDNGVNVQDYINVDKKRKAGEVTYIGRLDVHKGVDKLIKLAAEFKKQNKKITLNIVGPDSKGLLEGLKKMVLDNELENHVVFHGAVSLERLHEIISYTDVFVSASEYEGFGISAVEAMAAGTPCVLNKIESFQKLSVDNEFVRVVDFKNVRQAEEALSYFLNLDSDKYRELSDLAKGFSKKFDWENVANLVEETY